MSQYLTPETIQAYEDWLTQHQISEVECIVPDCNGVARGKILPSKRFVSSLKEDALRVPESIFLQTVTGDMIDSDVISDIELDVILVPDFGTLRLVPWYEEPTAQIICDAYYKKWPAGGICPPPSAQKGFGSLCGEGLEARDSARGGVLPRQTQYRPRLPVGASHRPQWKV
jgi:Glutamine synthetase